MAVMKDEERIYIEIMDNPNLPETNTKINEQIGINLSIQHHNWNTEKFNSCLTSDHTAKKSNN